ncbi:MAG: hypothetical protein ABIB43_06155 [archaeon]
MKRHMTKDQEFDIMKMVLDKFLWVGTFIMVYAFYKMITLSVDLVYGLAIMVSGVIILLLFMWLLVKEYHFMK